MNIENKDEVILLIQNNDFPAALQKLSEEALYDVFLCKFEKYDSMIYDKEEVKEIFDVLKNQLLGLYRTVDSEIMRNVFRRWEEDNRERRSESNRQEE